jgi:hypothetical protein
LGSPVHFHRVWRTKCNCKYASNGFTITVIIKKFDKNILIHHVIRKIKEQSQKRKYSISKLKMVISEDQSLPIRNLSQVAEISYSLTRFILKDDSDLKPYELPDFHQLQPANCPNRLVFGWNSFQEMLIGLFSQINRNFTLKI